MLELILATQDFTNSVSERIISAHHSYLPNRKVQTQMRILNIATMPQQTRIAAAKERRARIDLTKERGARRRILEKWDDIEKEYGNRIDGRCVLRVLNRDLDEKKPTLKTVQNHLSGFRAEGLIP